MAADIDHAIDGGGAAEALAAGACDLAIVDRGFGLRIVTPIIGLGRHGIGERRGHLDQNVSVAAAGFDQKDGVPAALAQSIGEHATRGARAHDDVVKNLVCHAGAPHLSWRGA